MLFLWFILKAQAATKTNTFIYYGDKVEVEIQTWPKLKEIIKYKKLIKLSIGIIDLFKDLIREKKFEGQFDKNKLKTLIKLIT